MNSGYDQFFKNARNAAEGKPAAIPSSNRTQKSVTAAQFRAVRKNKEKKKTPFPVLPFVISAIGFCLAYAGFENYERISHFMNRVELSLFTTARASEDTNKADAKKEETTQFTKPVVAEPTGEELNHLTKLAERKKELDAREEELNRLETEMAKQKEELQKKIVDLEKMRSSISNLLEERVKADDQKIETLVQFYSNMKPPQAAKVFETIDEDLAVQILGRMKKKNAAEILNLMKAEKAQMFTEKYAGYKRTVASKPAEAAPASEEAPETPRKP